MTPTAAEFGLAAALLAAGAVVGHWLRLPPLPVYLAVGVLVGESLDVSSLEPLPTVGLLLLLFAVGQEFGPHRLRNFGRKSWAAGAWDGAALAVGFVVGLMLGLGVTGAALLGAVFYVSSSAVIAKVLIDLKRTGYPEGEVVLGITVLEDLVVLLILTLFATGGGLAGFAASIALAAGYLAASQILAPHLVRLLESLSDELVILLITAFTTGSAMMFHLVGASAAVGAFLCGVISAGLGLQDRLERLLGPVRDLAVAFFFFTVGADAVGALSDLTTLAIALCTVALIAKLPFDYLAGRAAGLAHSGSLSASVLLLPRGEFNLVIAALAVETGHDLVAQVAILTVLVSVPLGTLLARYEESLLSLPLSRSKPMESEDGSHASRSSHTCCPSEAASDDRDA